MRTPRQMQVDAQRRASVRLFKRPAELIKLGLKLRNARELHLQCGLHPLELLRDPGEDAAELCARRTVQPCRTRRACRALRTSRADRSGLATLPSWSALRVTLSGHPHAPF